MKCNQKINTHSRIYVNTTENKAKDIEKKRADENNNIYSIAHNNVEKETETKRANERARKFDRQSLERVVVHIFHRSLLFIARPT